MTWSSLTSAPGCTLNDIFPGQQKILKSNPEDATGACEIRCQPRLPAG
jgi:hypothetical protein